MTAQLTFGCALHARRTRTNRIPWRVGAVVAGVAIGTVILRTDASVSPPIKPDTAPSDYRAAWQRPRAIAVDALGRTFALDMTSHVYRFGQTGGAEVSWRIPDQTTGSPSGLCVDRNGHVWVADTHNHRVLAYSPDGELHSQFGSLGTGPGEFLFPNDVLVLDAAPGEPAIYVCEYGGNDRVSAFDSERRFLFEFGDRRDFACSLSAPYAMCAGRNGETVWIADTGNHRLCEFRRDGRFVRSLGGPGDPEIDLRVPSDIVYLGGDPLEEAASALLAVCRQSSLIVIIDLGSGTSTTWGTPGRSAGCLNGPQGMAALPSGDLLVANTEQHEILRIPYSAWRNGSKETPPSGERQ